ncbi:MAG: hypothetical protein KAJ91_02375 [Candidatus Aenigmarchaeota archaeon]|nr:hypothetical protein [Candidatus Aenigmarchaeota archaeon]
MRSKLLLVFVVAFSLFSGLAHATFTIDVQRIEINPSYPHVGDEISVEARFYIGGRVDPKVRLYLYVDGELRESHIDFYDIGTSYHTFRFDTDSMYAGKKEIVVEAEVYDGSYLDDYSSRKAELWLEDNDGVSTAHDITITQMSFKTPVLSGEKFGVTAFVKNTGALEERDVRIFVRIGDEIERSDYFDIKRGETRAKTIYIRAPEIAGTHTVTIEAENRASHTVKSTVDVVSASLSMNVIPETTTTGQWMTVSGYALVGADYPAGSVAIYKDGQYATKAYPDRSGYYSTSVRFFNPGRHSIAVRLGDIEKYAVVSVNAEPEPILPEDCPPVDSTGDTIIIVNGVVQIITNGTEVIPGDGSGEPPVVVEDLLEPYVSVAPSAKEIYVEQYRANTMYIEISNHLGRTANFDIKTDFDQRLVFAPEVKTIENGETKAFALVFNPGDAFSGFIAGTIDVYEEETLVESIPVSVFVIQKRAEAAEVIESTASAPTSYSVLYYAVAGIVAMAMIGSLALHFRKQRPLEPKVLASTGVGLAGKVRTTMPRQRKLNVRNMRNIFRVPWSNVIC